MESHQIIITILVIVVMALTITLSETIGSNKRLQSAMYRWAKRFKDQEAEISELKKQRDSILNDLSDARKEIESLKPDFVYRY